MLLALLRRLAISFRHRTGRLREPRPIIRIEALEDRTLPSATILEAFNFGGTTGAQLSQNPDTVAANVTGGAVSRGAGLLATNQNNIFGFGNAISSVPTGYVYGTSLSSAATLNQYYQFTVASQSGYSLSLTGLSFNAYDQNVAATFAAGLEYSVDGGNTFTAVPLTGSLSGASQRSPAQVSASLSSATTLQNATGSIVFRIFLYGVGSYENSGIGQTASDNDLQVTGSVNPVINTAASGIDADNAAGGWTGSGIVGQYFNNTTFAGTPSFTRTDDRIDFASNSSAPGGSTAPGFNAVGASNFSVLWTGSLIPAFSATYSFDGFAADTFNLQISPAGQNNWMTVVNQTAYTGANFGGTYTFTAGQTYNVKIQFVQYTGPWAAQLRWSNPNTPDAVINPLSDSGINAVTYSNTTYADAIKMGLNQWYSPGTYTPTTTDASGWPTTDATNIVWQGANGPEMAGTYLLQFNGQANVSINFNFATFTVNGQTYNSLPAGVGYNPATNTTSALVNVTNQATILYLNFTNSQRTQASALDTGVTNVHLMRPTSPGATTYYPLGTLFDANLESEYSNFTVERWLTANNDVNQVNWSQRVLPTFAEADYLDNDEVWEYEVELANETGKDLYITIPINANATYVTDLAELIKYGSDGVNPYTSFQANPAYPGLNGNLHLYIEWSNETWNFGTAQAGAAVADSQKAVADYLAGNTSASDYANGAIIDYDGQAPTGDFRRWTALMTVEASNIFRSVWGSAAMGNDVRPLLEYQYDNDQDTALDELEFINGYFNNGNGLHNVVNPEPVSYYLWGSGAAVYYSSPNPTGTQTAITVPDGSFETPVVAANTDVVDPSGSSWTFTGNAGIYNGGGMMGSLGGVQIAPDGSQAAFIGDTGSISTTINFTQIGTFAIQLQATNKFGDENGLRLYLNGQEITPDYQNDPDYNNPFDNPWVPGQYMYGVNDTIYNSLGTAPFTISTVGNYTLTIVGTGAVGTYTFLDAFQVTSLAAIFNAGVPGLGQANGEITQAVTGYQAALNAQATFAETFGLHVVAYEGGWSLAGDSQETPLESYAKYLSTQATQANITSYNDFIQSGGALYVYGTYEQWPIANTSTANSFALLQGVDATNNILPSAATNGLAIPAALTPANATLADGNSGSTLNVGGYVSWNVLVPSYGSYLITATTNAGGNAVVLLDDATTVAAGLSGGTLSGSLTLTPGLHTILVEAASGSFSVIQAAIAPATALNSPILNSTQAGNAEVTLAWSAVSGATGYRIRYGTVAGIYTGSIAVGNVLTFTVPGLTNGQGYYFAVDAYNSASESLPSNAIEDIPINPNAVTTLASWSFSGYVGNETNAPVALTTSLVSATPLIRGPGLLNDGNTILSANTFASGALGYAFALNAPAAIAASQYYQFTITPIAGQTLSLQTLNFSAWYQNATGQGGDGRGAALTWSIDGQNFSSALIAAGIANSSPSPFTVDLSGQAGLQNVTATVTIRIYLYGSGKYETCGLGGISVLGKTGASGAIATTTVVTAVSTLTATTSTAVTFTATVTAISGVTAPNSGVVEFLSGTTVIATATMETMSGSTATFSVTTNVAAGIYGAIQAFYISSGTGFASSNSSAYGSTLSVYAPPVFSGSTSTSIVAGASQVQTFSGVSASGNATFSLINVPPAWVTINALTGVLIFGQSVAVPNYSSSNNTFTITIQAASPGGIVTESFTIILTPAGS